MSQPAGSSIINEHDLQQALLMLQALRDPTRPDHAMAMQSLETYVLVPAFIYHILHIFVQGQKYQIPTDLRQLAGFVVKNYVFAKLHLIQDSSLQLHIQHELLQLLSDAHVDIRKTAALLIGNITKSFPMHIWIEMVARIISLLDVTTHDNNFILFMGGLTAMKRIVEDSVYKLSSEEVPSYRPIEHLVPQLLTLLSSPFVSIPTRIFVLETYNSLLYLLEGPASVKVNGLRSRNTSFDSNHTSHSQTPPPPHMSTSPLGGKRYTSPPPRSSSECSPPSQAQVLINHLPSFISTLSHLGGGEGSGESALRKTIMVSLTLLSCLAIALLDPYLQSIIQYALERLREPDEEIAMEACEFFSSLLYSPPSKTTLVPYLSPLLEGLVGRLYLTPEQMEGERQEEEEVSRGERQVKIAPLHRRTLPPQPPSSSQGEGDDDETGEGDDGGAGGGGGEEDELSLRWTLRKQSALLLDNLSGAYPPSVLLPLSLPIIEKYLQEGDVMRREQGMLALGALCNGCLYALSPFLPPLFPLLLSSLSDPLPEMRSIACWVLSKFSALYPETHAPSPDNNSSSSQSRAQSPSYYYLQSLYTLLPLLLDPHPKVQVAALSAMSILVEHSYAIADGDEQGSEDADSPYPAAPLNILTPHILSILATFHIAFPVYGNKSKLLSVDMIGVLIDTLGAEGMIHPPSILHPPCILHSLPQYVGRYHLPALLPEVQRVVVGWVEEVMKAKPGGDGAGPTPLQCIYGGMQLYVPLLMQFFFSLDDYDARIFPLLECLRSLGSYLSTYLPAHALLVWLRGLRLLGCAVHGDKEYRERVGLGAGIASVGYVDLVQQLLSTAPTTPPSPPTLPLSYLHVLLQPPAHPAPDHWTDYLPDVVVCTCEVMASILEGAGRVGGEDMGIGMGMSLGMVGSMGVATYLFQKVDFFNKLLFQVYEVSLAHGSNESLQSLLSLWGEVCKYHMYGMVWASVYGGNSVGNGAYEGLSMAMYTTSLYSPWTNVQPSTPPLNSPLPPAPLPSLGSLPLVTSLFTLLFHVITNPPYPSLPAPPTSATTAYPPIHPPFSPHVFHNAVWVLGEGVGGLRGVGYPPALVAELLAGIEGSMGGGGGGLGERLTAVLNCNEVDENVKVTVEVTLERLTQATMY